MSTAVRVNTFTHSVNYVAYQILYSLKEIVRESGLDPAKLTQDWRVLESGLATWLDSRHLRKVILEVSKSRGRELVGRWEFEVEYVSGWGGDGSFSADPDEIRYHIIKAGIYPSGCDYTIFADTAPGYPRVAGWTEGQLLPTDGFHRYTIGTSIDGGHIKSNLSYWRKP